VALPKPLPASTRDEECVLTVVVTVDVAEPWAPRGFEVARVQVVLPPSRRAPRPSGHSWSDWSDTRAHPSDDAYGTDADEFVRWAIHGQCIPGAPVLAVWRAPTDNDGLKLAELQDLKPLGRWRAAGLDALEVRTNIVKLAGNRRPGRSVIEREHVGADVAITQREVWAHRADGSIVVREDVLVPDGIDDVPRIGIRWDLPPVALDHVTWYGRGPVESYPDRRRGAHLGRFTQTLDEQYVPYVMPQEHGGHADTRWGVVHTAVGWGLLVTAAEPFQWNVSRWSPEQITLATHAEELEAEPGVPTMHLDFRHRGLGTLSCGPDTLPEYRIGPGRYRFTWAMRPVHVRRDPLAEIAAELRAACRAVR
jgi:beta-galactosidase